MKDNYQILGLERGASVDEIKKAFRTWAHTTHPDKPGGDAKRFVEIKNAYDALMANPDQGKNPYRWHDAKPTKDTEDIYATYGFKIHVQYQYGTEENFFNMQNQAYTKSMTDIMDQIKRQREAAEKLRRFFMGDWNDPA